MIDTSQWKEFRFSDIFDVRRGERILKDIDYLKKPDENNCFPVITAKTVNNGIDGYYDKVNCTGNCLVACGEASGMFTTYQSEECWCLDTVRIITLKSELISMTPNIGLFLATILSNNMYRFSYGRKAKPDNMNTLDLLLPATATGEPDWQFMEEFMGGLHAKPLTTSVQSSHIPLNTEEWGEFRIGDLFEVKIAKSSDIGNLEDGNVKFIGRSEENNGVQGLVTVAQEKITIGKCITVAMVGTNVALWQNDDFTCSQNIATLRNKQLNSISALFVATVLNIDMKYKYSYGRTISKEKLSDTIIKLPATITGEPDWYWMENYMKSLPFSDKIQ